MVLLSFMLQLIEPAVFQKILHDEKELRALLRRMRKAGLVPSA